MPTPIVMPRLGMTMTEGTVVEWPHDVGADVQQGEPVLIIESDKSEIEVEASSGGKLAHIYVEPEELVPCGTLLGVLVGEDESDFDAAAYQEAFVVENDDAVSPGGDPPAMAPAAALATRASTASTRRRGTTPVTPAARALARTLEIDPGRVLGSGPGGRVKRRDIEAFAKSLETLVEVADGVSLEVPTEGSGDPVLLLPGFGTDVSAFSAQSPVLAERFLVRGVNARGIGNSDAPDAERYDIATLAADAAALLEAPTHLVATSLGTAVAIELALAAPEKIRSLSLLAPLVEVSPRLEAVSRAWCDLAALGDVEVLARSLLPWFFGTATLGDEKRRERIARGLPATLSRARPEALRRTRAGMNAWSGTRVSDLARIAAPTLVIAAEEDLLTPDGASIAESIPGARLVSIPGAGHAVGLEASDDVNAALLAHLAAS